MARLPSLPPFRPPDFKVPARISAAFSKLQNEAPRLLARAVGGRRAGRFTFDGLIMEPGQGIEPWDLPSPSRAFATALHGMNWLPDLLAIPNAGRTALSLVLGWHAVFGRWNAFSWSPDVLERRVFNLACAMGDLTAEALESEQTLLLDTLARQARELLLVGSNPARAAEQAAAAAIAGCALAGKAGDGLRQKALRKLEQALRVAVLPDGGHASRSPEAALELLFDLRTLDEALQQLGREPPEVLSRAIDRLTGAVRFFTLADGGLPAMQGSEAGEPERIAAALPPEEPLAKGEAPHAQTTSAPYSGYEKLTGRKLQAFIDVGPPAEGAWSEMACAQPLALEVLAGTDRLIANTGWSPRAPTAQALRLTPAGCCANVADASSGQPLQGLPARVLGHRLEGGAREVTGRRHEAEGGSWLEYTHDGWARVFGLTHGRRLYLDQTADELRGEDVLMSAADPFAQPRHKPAFLTVRFQMHPDVKVSLALDHKSVLLQGPSSGGWWLRNDAPEVRVEPGVHMVEGRPQQTQQVVMRTLVKRDGTARLRWKISAS